MNLEHSKGSPVLEDVGRVSPKKLGKGPQIGLEEEVRFYQGQRARGTAVQKSWRKQRTEDGWLSLVI